MAAGKAVLEHLPSDLLDAVMICIDYGVVNQLVLHQARRNPAEMLLQDLIQSYKYYAGISRQQDSTLEDRLEETIDVDESSICDVIRNKLKGIDELPGVLAGGDKTHAELSSKDFIHKAIAKAIYRLIPRSDAHRNHSPYSSIGITEVHFQKIIMELLEHGVTNEQVLNEASASIVKNDLLNLIATYAYFNEVYPDNELLAKKIKDCCSKTTPLTDSEIDQLSSLKSDEEAANITKAATLCTIRRLIKTINNCLVKNTSLQVITDVLEHQEMVHVGIAKRVSEVIKEARENAAAAGKDGTLDDSDDSIVIIDKIVD